MKTLFTALAVATVGLAFTAASASANLVTNGDFEAGLSGWISTGSGVTPGIGITVIPTGTGGDATGYGDIIPSYAGQGSKAVFFVDDLADETLSQTLSGLSAGSYSLSFALFATASGAANPGFFTLTDALGSLVGSFGNTDVPVGSWVLETAGVAIPTTGDYTLSFHFNAGTTPSKDVVLDAVSLSAVSVTPTAVPEPMSLALLGSSLFGLGLLRRRR